jgi:hypothetical protein
MPPFRESLFKFNIENVENQKICTKCKYIHEIVEIDDERIKTWQF